MQDRKQGFYERFVKRALDVVCSLLAIVVFGWLYLILAVLIRTKMGKPVLFKQLRPGRIDEKTGREIVFEMYKFRTMTDERGEDGTLLPDEQRLNSFGKWLRRTSLDELPELFNILRGDMSLIGPRPQLVRDMVFMSDEVRKRHIVRPGLSGLAQVEGRNAIDWNKKFELDLQYLENICLKNDFKILWKTVRKVFLKPSGVESAETDITLDYGDWLLSSGAIDHDEYLIHLTEAEKILDGK